MAFQVELRSKEQWLGDLVRALLVYTDANDLARGSNTSVLLEAMASAYYQISVSSLKILQSTNLEALTGQQLDKKAESIKLPNGIGGSGRRPATQASGPVVIGSSFAKISSKLYAGKPAPFGGSDKLYVEDASSFPVTGSVYIGRGTVGRFEGPIPYSSVTDNGSFWTVNLTTPLTKSHLLSDLVVLSQGGDRSVAAGTIVQIAANNQSPAISFATTQELIIPDGEAEGQVSVVCTQFGEVGNALTNSISDFSSVPFGGATVRNSTTYSNGKSTESDEALRLRIKNYPATLSRGTKSAILSAIIGATDADSGLTIQSAVVLDPVEPGDFARVFIDSGAALEPTFDSQAYELLLESAAGQERRFRTAQFPITAAVAEGSEFAPYVLVNGQSITVEVDGVLETYSVTGSNYENINAATAYEVVRDLNSQSNLVGFRTLDGGTRITMIDLSGSAEQVIVQSSDLQETLGFPTSILRPIFIYKNSQLQSFRGSTATLETRPRNQWSVTVGDLAGVRVSIDGVIVEFTIVDADFAEFGTSVASATVSQWATIFSRKIPGVKFVVSGQLLVWSTRNTFASAGTLEILETKADGTPAGWIGDAKIWKPVTSGGKLTEAGAPKDYSFNRFTGEITFASKLVAGDKVEVASRNTRAHVISETALTGQFSLAPIGATIGNARFVAAFDGDFFIRETGAPSGTTITPSVPDATNASNVLRLTASAPDLFLNAEVGDWLYLIKDTAFVPAWSSKVEGFYRLKAVGFQNYASDQTYSGLVASGYTMTAANASVLKDRAQVRVFVTNHGLQTGDLVTISTANAIGGISAGNLSAANATVLVVDDNTFDYTSGAAATSNASGVLDYVGTNVISVAHSAHGFESGAFITTAVTTGFAGISNTNLSRTNVPIEVLTPNTYRYRALAATSTFPMPAAGSITTLTYKADCWVEFEVSVPQLSDWTALLGSPQSISPLMTHLFKSTSTPQLVDFGNVSSLNIDQIVTIVNNQIEGGSCVKLSPQQFEIRSNDFTSGTCAVLAVIGNAENALEETISVSLQYHVGYSQSGNTQAGFIVVDDVKVPTAPASGHGTRTYLEVDCKFVDILDRASNPAINSPTAITPAYPEGFEHAWLTGRQAGLFGRVYNNQTAAPYTGLMRGENMVRPLNESDTEQTSPDSLNRYANYGLRLRDLNVNNFDKLVVEMDLDPTDKTVSVQLSKLAKIQDIDAITGAGKGQVISFRLKDPEDGDKAFFDNTSVYKTFDFADFKLLTKSVGLYREDVSDRALILRSTSYGGQHRLRFSMRYPETPSQATATVTHTNSYLDVGSLTLIVGLPSGSLIAGSTFNSGTYKVVSAASGSLFNMRITSGSINSGNEYQPDNIINISGASALASSYKITSAAYNSQTTVVASTSNASNVVTLTINSHGLQTGDLVSVSAANAIGGISGANLTQVDTPVTVINSNQFSYVAGATAAILYSSSAASVTNGSNIVTVTINAHGFNTGELFTVSTGSAIGGISAGNLSQANTSITVINANQFTYVAAATATSDASGTLTTITRASSGTVDAVTYGSINFIAPGDGGISSALFSAAATPVRSWTLVASTFEDVATAINAYYPDFPVATAVAIGTNFVANPIVDATYITYPQVAAYTGDDMSGAFDYNSFFCKLSGEAGVWQYNSSNVSLNNIKATVQSLDSIFPTTTEASGTAYTPINEEVYLVPTNSKTLQAWLDFNAASSLNLLANIERIQSDGKLQLSSKEDGSAGAVKVTGVTANVIEAFLEGNATESNESTKATILSADSKAMNRGSAVLVQNSIATEIQRPYRFVPSGASVTTSNIEEINTFFRKTNAVKYIRMNATTGRLLFLRDGQGPSQNEFFAALNTVQFTNLGNGLVQVISAQGSGPSNTGALMARTGDMMYIRADASSPFTVDQRCKTVPSSGQTDGTNPEYLGYPVVHVIDDNNIVVIAPNITNFATITLGGATASTDLVFLPAVWNEKNIRTNHKEGADFDHYVTGGKAYFLVKTLGSGLVSVWLQNSASEATDSMLLANMSVSSDDFAVLGSQFDPANQGTFRIVAHNGRNHLILYNPEGGKDELIDTNTQSNGGLGDRKWRVGPVDGGVERPIRILSGESVRIGDKLRISTPESAATQWFNSAFLGSWVISKIGLSAFNFSGALPHSYGTGSFSLTKLCPYIDIDMTDAPLGITDTNGAFVDSFLIALNDRAIGFVEGEPYQSVRMIVGTAVSPQDPELGEVFMVPKIATGKMSDTFGTALVAMNKTGYEQRAFQGIDGYKVYGDLVREAHRIIDGLPTNTVLFPGVKAAGTIIEVLPPLIKTVKVSLSVRPKDGVTLNSITDLVKSTVTSYTNGLGVGSPVVLSEIIRSVQSLPGVFSVQILSTTPVADQDRIVVSESERAFIINAASDVTLG